MESPHPLCIICGTRIPYRSPRQTWQREFRAIRCDQNSSLDGKPFLTGVGSYISPRIPDCAAPSRQDDRWNNRQNYEISVDDRFPPLIGHWARPQPGFLFHDACWELLQRLLYPIAVSAETLYDICLSCPVDVAGWLDWGHSYGGLMDRLPRAGYPWEDVYIVGFVKRYLGDMNSPLSFAVADPLDVPEIHEALVDTRKRDYDCDNSSAGDDAGIRSISPLFRGPVDCFRQLPQEVLEYIQTILPSGGVVNARMASRSFASLPLDHLFWASRFDSGHERGYCVEAQHPLYSDVAEKRERNWEALYHKTVVTPTSSDELKNRKRIVDCSRNLVDILLEQPLINETTLTRNLQTSLEDPNNTKWRSIGGDFTPRPNSNTNHFPSGMRCRRIYDQVLTLPSSPIKFIAVTFRRFNGTCYISGLRFTFEHDSEALMGYVIPHRERRITLHDGDGENFYLTGFITAVGARGIMALRAVSDKGNVSDWAGSPGGLPQSLRLCMRNRIETLKGCFDAMKLIYLSVLTQNMKTLFPESPSTHLRTSALWYPTLPHPPSTQNLHDISFPAHHLSSPSEYRPLVHIMFGGQNGALLSHLVKISVTVSRSAIVGVDFFYDTPVHHHHAASRSKDVYCIQSCPSTASADTSDKIPFKIDGPADERLVGIHGEGDFFLGAAGEKETSKHGVMTGLKVITNHNRSFTFQPSAIPILKLPVGPYVRQRAKRATIEEGETLTGIYFMHDAKYGMTSIGSISEDLNSTSRCDNITGIENEIRAQMTSS